jgi:predicted metalloprotease with PDZ domain
MILTRTLPLLIALTAAAASAQPEVGTASYETRVLDTVPARIAIHATLPSAGATLTMADSRPGDVPELAEAGWPALVQRLMVRDSAGQEVASRLSGPAGWTLARQVDGAITLDYEVDLAPLAARGWPAPREAAFADAEHLVVIGRALFITTPAQQASTVRFAPPTGWRAVAPWPLRDGRYAVAAADDLAENLVAFSREPPDTVSASGFEVEVVALGKWRAARPEVRRVLHSALERLVAVMGLDRHADYLVALLPQDERGGESFRASFALTVEDAPSRSNLGGWGNTIAHELFHYWNGWRLRGADYASTQWFQEGFTEYAANQALLASGLVTGEAYRAQLARQVEKYRKLTTPLDAPGSHKGPPLYSGGALTAFCWDTRIREATHGAAGLGEMFRALWRITEHGAHPYAWADIQQALETAAPGDWAEFRRRHIQGGEPLPLAAALARLGWRSVDGEDGMVRIELDPAATPAARARGRAFVQARRTP